MKKTSAAVAAGQGGPRTSEFDNEPYPEEKKAAAVKSPIWKARVPIEERPKKVNEKVNEAEIT